MLPDLWRLRTLVLMGDRSMFARLNTESFEELLPLKTDFPRWSTLLACSFEPFAPTDLRSEAMLMDWRSIWLPFVLDFRRCTLCSSCWHIRGIHVPLRRSSFRCRLLSSAVVHVLLWILQLHSSKSPCPVLEPLRDGQLSLLSRWKDNTISFLFFFRSSQSMGRSNPLQHWRKENCHIGVALADQTSLVSLFEHFLSDILRTWLWSIVGRFLFLWSTLVAELDFSDTLFPHARWIRAEIWERVPLRSVSSVVVKDVSLRNLDYFFQDVPLRVSGLGCRWRVEIPEFAVFRQWFVCS